MENSVTKNTMFLTLASIGQKFISFLFFIFVARLLGVEDTGKYFFAFSFTGLFVVLVDIGLSNVLVREGARNKGKLGEYVSAILWVKMFLAGFAYLCMVLVLQALGYSSEMRILVYVAGISMIFDSIQLTLYGVLRAVGNLRYEAIGIVLGQAVASILGLFFLFFGFPLVYLIGSFTVASFACVVYVSSVLVGKYKIIPIPRYNSKLVGSFLLLVIPFALAAIFARVYSTVDSILLSKLGGDTAVGLYSVPSKITAAFQFIPLALTASMYPRFSEYFVTEKALFSKLFHECVQYLFIIVLPVAVGIALLAPQIVTTLYTNAYAGSVLPLRIFMVSLCFSFLSFPIGSILNASNRQTTQTVIVGCVMLVNIFGNLFFIPWLGVTGAAFMSLVSNFILTLVGYACVVRVVPPNKVFALSLLKIVIATSAMAVAVYFSSSILSLIYSIGIGVLVYIPLLFLLRVVTVEEFRLIFQKATA